MKKILNYLFEKNTLSKEQAKDVLLNITKGIYSDSEIASFLTIYLMRKILPAELSGFREALLERCIPVDVEGQDVIDVCGTGGDEKNTFNISTLSSFVIAGAGYKVVKHGNYGVSSAVGSSNVIEHLGYRFSNDQDKIKKELDAANICYLHAPFFHPAMKHVANVRKSLKLKTFFNLLGPMVNPAKPKKQIVGVFSLEVQDLYKNVYSSLDIDYFILHSLDAYDEISLTSDFRAVSKDADKVYTQNYLGLDKLKQADLYGGETLVDSAKIFLSVLDGSATVEQTSAVLANAAFGIKCYNPDSSMEECVSIARTSIESGSAKKSLQSLLSLQ